MRRVLPVVLAATVLMALLCTPLGCESAPPTESELRAKIDALVQPLLDNEVIVGMIVGVRRGDQEHYFAYGRVSKDGDAAPTADTVYEIGSITKTFTGVLLAGLALEGKVKLEAPAQDYMPDELKLPVFEDEPITIAHLATHTSGLPRMADNFAPKDANNPYADYNVEACRTFLAGHKLRRKPGEYEYSNFALGLLGHIVARSAGKEYEPLLVEKICDPLGMADTRITLTDSMRERFAPPYNADLEPSHNWDFALLAPCGAIRSTARDLLKYAAVVYAKDDSPLTKAMKLATQARPESDKVGLGWHRFRGDFMVMHDGGTGGYRSTLNCVPSEKLAVVALTNTTSEIMSQLGVKLVKTALGEDVEPMEVLPLAKVAPEILDHYVGKYWLFPFFAITITHVDGRLMAQATNQGAFRIYPASVTEFFYRVVDAQIDFVADDKGEITKLVLHQNGKDMNGYRQPDPKAAKPAEEAAAATP